MNGLQSGSPASQLAPQAYKNSSQNTAIQNTYDGASIQQSSGLDQSLNVLPATGTLRVVDSGQSSNVLGASTSESYSVSANLAAAQPKTNYVPITILIVIVSLALATYFFKKYRSIVVVENEE